MRWEAAEPVQPDAKTYAAAIALCEESIAAAVKKAKNELKNTLSQPETAVLLPFDNILYSDDGRAILQNGAETIALTAYPDVPGNLHTLRAVSTQTGSGAVFGMLRHDGLQNLFTFSPLSVLTPEQLIRL